MENPDPRFGVVNRLLISLKSILAELRQNSEQSVGTLVCAGLRHKEAYYQWEIMHLLNDLCASTKANPYLTSLPPELPLDVKEAVREAIPVLIEKISNQDSDRNLRIKAILTLEMVGGLDHENTIPALVEAFKTDNHDDGWRLLEKKAKWYLVKIGNSEVVSALSEVFFNTPSKCQSAAEALAEIGGSEIVLMLTEALNKQEVEDSAIDALGIIGPDAKDAVPALIEVLKDKNRTYVSRRNAASALGRIGPDAEASVPTLLEVSKDSSEAPNLREVAKNALISIG